MKLTRYLAPALALALVSAGPTRAADKAKDVPAFGTLTTPKADVAQTQAKDWLKRAGKTDAATLKAFDAIWTGDRPLLDKVAATLSLGDAKAAKLLAEARDPKTAPPTALPSLVKDTKLDPYFRANLALAYGRALAQRKVYEEALEAFNAVRAEDVVDPAAYLFHKAVSEHALMDAKQAEDSIDRLLVDVPEAPERYRMVAALMHFDIVTWKDKDLGWIARKMNNIGRRLDLTRGGKKTRKEEREVLVRLDEMIKELENKNKDGDGSGENSGNCPCGGPKKDANGPKKYGNPLDDSKLGGMKGEGKVDQKRLKEIAEVWGKLPEKERATAMLELTRKMPPKYREAIKEYFKQLERTKPTSSR